MFSINALVIVQRTYYYNQSILSIAFIAQYISDLVFSIAIALNYYAI